MCRPHAAPRLPARAAVARALRTRCPGHDGRTGRPFARNHRRGVGYPGAARAAIRALARRAFPAASAFPVRGARSHGRAAGLPHARFPGVRHIYLPRAPPERVARAVRSIPLCESPRRRSGARAGRRRLGGTAQPSAARCSVVTLATGGVRRPLAGWNRATEASRSMSGRFDPSALARLDAALAGEVLRLRARYQLSLDEFRGLYVSDEQVDALLARSAALPPERETW